MKKLLALLLTLMMTLSITSCGSTHQSMLNADGTAYNMEPQKLIDTLNKDVKAQNDSRYYKVPDYEKSGKEIYIKSIGLTLTIKANADKCITKIEIGWDAEQENATKNAGLYFAEIIALTSPDSTDEINKKLDILDQTSSMYSTSCKIDGTTFEYFSYGNARYNTLTVAPSTQSNSSANAGSDAQSSASDASAKSGSDSDIETKAPSAWFNCSFNDYLVQMAKAYDGFPQNPKTSDGKYDDGSKYTQYMVSIKNCISIQGFETSKGKLYDFMILSDANDIKNAGLEGPFDRVMLATETLFEPSEDSFAKISDKLNTTDAGYPSLEDGTSCVVDGSAAEFSYSVEDGFVSFTITPLA